MEDRGISQAVITRLPRYYRFLGDLKDKGVERVSSQELADMMNATASQIRQDFNNFGGFGQQGYGYNVELLYNEIGKILGLDKEHHMILVGSGNLGHCLANYVNFEKRGFIFEGCFDANPDLIGQSIRGIAIMPMDDMEQFVIDNNIDMAVITIPKAGAVEVANRLVKCGIKAIWNFAHIDLEVPDNVTVESVHLSESLMKLSYNFDRATRE